MSEKATQKTSSVPCPASKPNCGAAASFDTEAATFLRRRLRLVAGVLLIVIGILYVLPPILVYLAGMQSIHGDLLLSTFRLVHLSSWLFLLGFFFYMGRPILCLRRLLIADAVLLAVATATCLALTGLTDWGTFSFVFPVLALILVTRGIVVPSSARKTLVLSLLVAAAMLVFLLLLPRPIRMHDHIVPDSKFFVEAVFYEVLLLVAVGIATLASRVNFTLRKQVHEAKRFGAYELEERIGEGGMGEVYRATHALLKRPTALKLLRPEITGKDALDRFENEVRQTSRLTHPNTISIFDYGQTPEGIFFYAMELLDGVDLDKALALGGPMPPERVIHILAQACSALEEAHDLELIHRDIKPGNIILCKRGRERDVVKVLDFGLVKDLRSLAPSLTQTGVFVGTPATGAPETFFGENVSPAADLYSLGVVGYKLLTGVPVFDADSVTELVRHHLSTPPEYPSSTGVTVPPDLEATIMACLAKAPEDRPGSASELRDRLLACVDAGKWTSDDAQEWWGAHVESDGAKP